MDSVAARGPSRLLVLGGTAWLGAAVAREALSREHEVVCLARGESGPAPEGARLVRADRTGPGAYDALADLEIDSVVEVSWQPDLVRSALEALAERVAHWVYVSSVSVYTDDATPGADESAQVHPAWTGTGPVTIEEYGPAKVACEEAVRGRLGARRCTIARTGLIAGYGDRSDRFGYWPARMARARETERVLVPPPDSPVQAIDVLDLAAWLVDCAERRTGGTFNATGNTLPFERVLTSCSSATGRQVIPVPAEDDWLVSHGVEPYMGPESLPLWVPRTGYGGHSTRRNDAAKAAGLRLRPIEGTVHDALRWERELGLDRARRAGLTPERERSLLCELSGGAD